MRQKNEKLKTALVEKQQQLNQALHSMHDLVAIKAYAQSARMEKIKLSQIKSLSNEHTT